MINPTPAQVEEIAGSDVAGEIVMVNLLKFSDTPEEYGKYEEIAARHLAEAGARIIWIGAARHLVIGDPRTDAWDAVALVAYPSREAFVQMVTATSYGEALEHRERGLAGTVLVCCTELPLDREQR
jgi:uncharacterized protein (DUF1330 family)